MERGERGEGGKDCRTKRKTCMFWQITGRSGIPGISHKMKQGKNETFDPDGKILEEHCKNEFFIFFFYIYLSYKNIF